MAPGAKAPRKREASEGCPRALLAQALERSNGSVRPLFLRSLPTACRGHRVLGIQGKGAKEGRQEEGKVGAQRGAMVWRSLVFSLAPLSTRSPALFSLSILRPASTRSKSPPWRIQRAPLHNTNHSPPMPPPAISTRGARAGSSLFGMGTLEGSGGVELSFDEGAAGASATALAATTRGEEASCCS